MQERFDFAAQFGVGAAGLVEVRGPAIGGQLDGHLENAALGHGALRHSDGRSAFPCANGAETPGDFCHPGASFFARPGTTAGAAMPWSRSSPLRPLTGRCPAPGPLRPSCIQGSTAVSPIRPYAALLPRADPAPRERPRLPAGPESPARPGRPGSNPGANDRPRVCAFACGGPARPGSGAWPRPPRRRSGRDGPSADPGRGRPAADRPHAPGRSPGASVRASPGPAAGRPASSARHRPAGRSCSAARASP